ncbi:DUF3179 domain-containing (seleno)protein [Natrinema gelatinilyticum]|uniref:DUF3179 domain-containing (seleno)protein n=1 Tax=Natrinema gelatinilyticum TaxID=2961571 RepID=UPI0020C588B6|nr:DUF3179 domain-containing (seleno)protein [Natrinema gelatinilyticum]
MVSASSPGAEETMKSLVDDLLVRDAAAHARAIEWLANLGDRRVVPHLIEVLMIHEIGSNWDRFGFPEVLRDHSPPRYLELPEARWPGALAALGTIAEPDYDSPYAWVEWESWYSQEEIEPLEGFDEWKLQLYRSYLPPVGRLLDAEPRTFDLQDVRWGNCDPSFLAACNEPAFVPGDAVTAFDGEGEGGDESGVANGAHTGARDDVERYLKSEDVVFGFIVNNVAYAVPQWVLFPHELANVTLKGVPLSLTYCTLCNAPILYNRRVGDQTLTFGSTGMLLAGNKIMFDEETESLWSQHRGVPIAGEYLEEGVQLEVEPVSQTTWDEWRETHPDSLALDIHTGYDFDYRHYEDNIGFFRYYWNDESAIQPGLRTAEGDLPEKTAVYGVTSDDGETVRVYPVEEVPREGVWTDEVDGREAVVVRDATDDVAVYEAPPASLERDGETLVDAEGNSWRLEPKVLVREDGRELPRIPGRHGLFFAFRSQYETVEIGSDAN